MRYPPARFLRARRLSGGPDPDVLATGAQMAVIALALIALIAALAYGELILAPLWLAIVIGLMCGPLADRIEALGIPPSISAAGLVIFFILLLIGTVTAFAVPLSSWLDRLPQIWDRLEEELRSWKGLIASVSSLRAQLREAMGHSTDVRVAVEDELAVESVAILAPAILAQVLIFLAGMYFFIATRHDIRLVILRTCVDRRLRWRVAHVFRDVEQLVSRYLLSITLVNIGLGLAVAGTLWAAGVPSPLVWGLMAFALNYVTYVGPAVMALILFGVGLATGAGTMEILVPPAIFLFYNFLEAQFVTPHVVGRTMTLNPFLVLLALIFWIWIWGPIGGFIAVPTLLILYATFRNIFPLSGTKAVAGPSGR